MENRYIDNAKAAYAARDYQAAIDSYVECLNDDAVEKAPGDLGFLYHQIGNAFLSLHDFNSAVDAYQQSVADGAYDACGAVNCNLGKAYAALRKYDDAVAAFEIATSDAKYSSRYKAHLGMGNALLKMGKNAEAGASFREAALDPSNPDPTKALLNLGVCFMALDRPADAVQSYESALQFDMDPDTRNKMYANLGQAYVACNQMQKAMNAFEAALADHTYFLSDSASVDYSRAATAVATGTAAMAPIVANDDEAFEPDMSGLDVTAASVPQAPAHDAYEPDPVHYPADAYGYDVNDDYASGDDRFFNASDEELEKYSKSIARQDRKRRNVGLKIAVFLFALLVVVAGLGVFAYAKGYGFPTAESVVSSLFADTSNPDKYFAKGVSSDSVEKDMASVVQDDSITVNGVERSMSSSTVYVTASAEGGEDVQYKVTLVRDFVSWKISDVELYFPSMADSSSTTADSATASSNSAPTGTGAVEQGANGAGATQPAGTDGAQAGGASVAGADATQEQGAPADSNADAAEQQPANNAATAN